MNYSIPPFYFGFQQNPYGLNNIAPGVTHLNMNLGMNSFGFANQTFGLQTPGPNFGIGSSNNMNGIYNNFGISNFQDGFAYPLNYFGLNNNLQYYNQFNGLENLNNRLFPAWNQNQIGQTPISSVPKANLYSVSHKMAGQTYNNNYNNYMLNNMVPTNFQGSQVTYEQLLNNQINSKPIVSNNINHSRPQYFINNNGYLNQTDKFNQNYFQPNGHGIHHARTNNNQVPASAPINNNPLNVNKFEVAANNVYPNDRMQPNLYNPNITNFKTYVQNTSPGFNHNIHENPIIQNLKIAQENSAFTDLRRPVNVQPYNQRAQKPNSNITGFANVYPQREQHITAKTVGTNMNNIDADLKYSQTANSHGSFWQNRDQANNQIDRTTKVPTPPTSSNQMPNRQVFPAYEKTEIKDTNSSRLIGMDQINNEFKLRRDIRIKRDSLDNENSVPSRTIPNFGSEREEANEFSKFEDIYDSVKNIKNEDELKQYESIRDPPILNKPGTEATYCTIKHNSNKNNKPAKKFSNRLIVTKSVFKQEIKVKDHVHKKKTSNEIKQKNVLPLKTNSNLKVKPKQGTRFVEEMVNFVQEEHVYSFLTKNSIL